MTMAKSTSTLKGKPQRDGGKPYVETVNVPDQVDVADIRSGSRVNHSIGVTNISGI